MKPFVLGGLMSEAYVRSKVSWNRQMDLYEQRVQLNQQPKFNLVLDPYNINHQFISLPLVIFTYLIATYWIHSHMTTRSRGYRIRWLLVLFDIINVLVSMYIIQSIIVNKFQGGMLLCNGLGSEPHIGYLIFYYHKHFELLHTIFLLLRKSFKQVTFLHILHHCAVITVCGMILPFEYNGDGYLPILLNSSCHLLVAVNYLLGTLGLGGLWLSIISSAQLAQFLIVFCHSLLSYRIGPTCGVPDFVKVLVILYMISLILLFVNYFSQKYIFGSAEPSKSLCGVVKRPLVTVNVKIQLSGIAQLNNTGDCIVCLPSIFPDAEKISDRSLRFQPFEVTYQLTPLEKSMPNLYVSKLVPTLHDLERRKTDDNSIADGDCDCVGSSVSFGISGGDPNGKVSWTIASTPINRLHIRNGKYK